MICEVTTKNALQLIRSLDKTTCTGLRIAAAYACYGTGSDVCRFYWVENSGALMVQGQNALFSGRLPDADELSSFLRFLHVKSFQSENTLLPDWQPSPQLLMKLEQPVPPKAAWTIDETPNLWQLSQSGLLGSADSEAWYADACLRVNKGFAAVRAVHHENAWIAMAEAQCITPNGVYLTAVATADAHRKKGCASSLLASFAQSFDGVSIYLLCKPSLRKFYEKRGFALVHPVCEYLNKDENA